MTTGKGDQMTISSRVPGVPSRAFNNALKAKLRDPTRSIRLLDFMTKEERETLLFTALGDPNYERYLVERNRRLNEKIIYVPSIRGEKYYGHLEVKEDV